MTTSAAVNGKSTGVSAFPMTTSAALNNSFLNKPSYFAGGITDCILHVIDCRPDGILLAADSRTTDENGVPLDDKYLKLQELFGHMFMSVSGHMGTAKLLITFLRGELPHICDEEKMAHVIRRTEQMSRVRVNFFKDPKRSISVIIGGFWTDPKKPQLCRVVQHGYVHGGSIHHYVSVDCAPILTAGSGSQYMTRHNALMTHASYDREHLSLSYHMAQDILFNTIKEAISFDYPKSGGMRRMVAIPFNGPVEGQSYEPATYHGPCELYRLV